ncbi:MAG TPA: hypothetical protein PKH77_23455 [Anaerolineae bacterium]|nr:hypothetical protein [Anaerolineae bacterium]
MFDNIFVLLPLLIFGVFVWSLIRQYRQIPLLNGFTDREKAVLARQVTALLIVTPLLLLYAASFATRQVFIPFAIYFAGGALGLGYVALTSIVYRVSILRGRGQKRPTQGVNAVVVGIFAIVFMLIVGWQLFFK